MNISSKLLSFGLFVPSLVMGAKKSEQPNIIIMLADDFGFDDMSLRGNTTVNTPNLDKMAKESTCFDNFYVHSVSAPTRASLLTGRHFLRTGVSGVHAGRDFMNLEEVTIASIFKDAGYKTGMWGKWHSGKTHGYFPWQRGFDEAYMADLYKHRDSKGLINGKAHTTSEWADAVVTDMAIDFIKRNKKGPFFAYIPFMTPHGKWDAPEEYVARKKKQGQSNGQAILNGMLEHLDYQVGRLFETLEDEGIDDNTIVLFFSDNGPINSSGDQKLTDAEWEQRNPSQYRGNKGQNFENGIHAPLFMYWKGHFQPVTTNSLACVMDILPTLCDIAGVDIPKEVGDLDGVSLKNILDNPTKEEKDRTVYISQWTIFWDWHDSSDPAQNATITPKRREQIDPEIQMIGLHTGDTKVLLNQWNEENLAMWNLADDYKETNNLAVNGTAQDKTQAKEYKRQVLDWYDGVLAGPYSYSMPTYVIGDDKETKFQILCYGAYDISEDLITETFKLSGFKNAGQFAQYKIRVDKPGTYKVRLKAERTVDETVPFRISTSSISNCGTLTIDDKYSNYMPIILTKGDNYLSLEMLESITGECKLNNFEFIYMEVDRRCTISIR